MTLLLKVSLCLLIVSFANLISVAIGSVPCTCHKSEANIGISSVNTSDGASHLCIMSPCSGDVLLDNTNMTEALLNLSALITASNNHEKALKSMQLENAALVTILSKQEQLLANITAEKEELANILAQQQQQLSVLQKSNEELVLHIANSQNATIQQHNTSSVNKTVYIPSLHVSEAGVDIVNGPYALIGIQEGRPAYVKLDKYGHLAFDHGGDHRQQLLWIAHSTTFGIHSTMGDALMGACCSSCTTGCGACNDVHFGKILSCRRVKLMESSSLTRSMSWVIGDSAGHQYYTTMVDSAVPPATWIAGVNGTDPTPTLRYM